MSERVLTPEILAPSAVVVLGSIMTILDASRRRPGHNGSDV